MNLSISFVVLRIGVPTPTAAAAAAAKLMTTMMMIVSVLVECVQCDTTKD